jgi:hypothetical protein
MEKADHAVPDEVSRDVNELRELVSKLPIASTLSNVALRTFLIDPKVVPGTETLSISAEYVTWLYVSLHKSAPGLSEHNGVTSEEDIERVRSLTKKIIEEAKGYHYSERQKGGRIGESIEDVLVATRIANLAIRGEAFPRHLTAQLHSLFDPFQTELKTKLGFDVTQALEIYEGLVKLINDRIHRLLIAFLRDSNREFLQLDHQPTNREIRELRNEILSSACKELRPIAQKIFAVTCDEITQTTRLAPSVVRSFLEFFTTCFGQPDPAEGWPSVHEALERGPFLKLSSDTWLIHLVIYSIFRFRSAIEKAIEPDQALWSRYERHRSDYLERHAVNLIKSTSIHANGWVGLTYTFDDGDGARDFELDGLVRVDKTAFLIEAKAGAMSPAARRGSKSAIDQVRRLVDEAQQQSARAARYIRSAEEVRFRSSKGSVRIRRKDLSRIYLISVTLDSLNAFTAHKSWLMKTGVVKPESAWSVCDLDLQVVTELVGGAGELVSFLEFRLAADYVDQLLVMEELDCLGLFFIMGGQPLRPNSKWGGVLIADWAVFIRGYYTGNLLGLPTSTKPRLLTSQTVARLIETLEKNGSPGFIDAIAILLSQTREERNCFSKHVDDLWRSRSNRKNLAFRMKLASGTVLCYTISRKMFKGYAKVAKYAFQSDLAVCILQKSKRAAQVSVERYPWRKDVRMSELTRNFHDRVKSHVQVDLRGQ